MPTRNYSNTAVGTSIPAGTTATATTFDVASLSGYPAVPFVITVDKTVPNKGEAMLVTAVAGVTLTVTRGYDGTAAVAHDPGAKVSHDHIAIDYREPQERLDKLETAAPPPRLQAPAFAAARPHDTIIEDVGENVCPNPSFEVDLTGWTAAGSNPPALARISGGISGGWVLKADFPASAGTSTVVGPLITLPAALTSDRILCTSIFALSSKNFTSTQIRYFLHSYNASGALISTQTGALQLKNRWARYSQSWALPNGTKTWRLEVMKDNYNEVAFTLHIDCAQYEYDRYTPSAYLDGSLGPGYTWDGTPHNSSSRRAAGVIVGRSASYLRLENMEVVRDLNAHLIKFGEAPEAREVRRFGGISIPDNRNELWPIGDLPSSRVRWDFSEGGTIGLGGYGYGALQTIIPWSDDSGGGCWQIFYSQGRWTNGLAGGGIMVRYGTRAGGWQAWRPLMQGDVQWNAASLTNGWVAYQQGWPDPSYRKMSDGTVHLRGMMMNGTGQAIAFWLPDGYKPSAQLLFPAQSSGGMTRLDVYADGRVYVAGPTAGWISLDAVRFRAEA